MAADLTQRPEDLLIRQRGGILGVGEAAWRFVRRYPVIPIAILVTLVLAGLLAPWIAPFSPTIGNLRDKQLPPMSRGWVSSAAQDRGEIGKLHILGTDHIGRDTLTRIIYGARISLMVAGISLASGFIAGTSIGILAGYVGGIWDEIITRIVDIWLALPFLMVVLVATILYGQSLQLLLVMLAALAWVGFVRVVRAQTLILKEMDYVALARVAGASPTRIMFKHILPGVVNSAVVIATLNVGGLILTEATLSFLGVGIPPPTPAWGILVAEGRDFIDSAWWQVIMPGAAIFLTLMSLNFLGDWLRDRLDPRLRQVD